MFTKIPFNVKYPLKIFKDYNIDFTNPNIRSDLFKRNIYYNFFGNEKNTILERNNKIYYDVENKVLEHLNTKYPNLDVLSLSLFGSSTVIEKPGDYDFLAITNGNVALLEEPILNLGEKDVQTGISIKGIENYTHGFKKKDESILSNRLEQIIDRTAISLYRRHIPLFGKDFINNEEEFQKNALAQVSDLVNNAYELFYLPRADKFVSNETRAKKILTRSYEATSYLGLLDSSQDVQKIRKEIYGALNEKFELCKSMEIFDKFGELYEIHAKDYSSRQDL